MVARGALIAVISRGDGGYWDISAEERVAIYQRYVELAKDYWLDAHGLNRVRQFLRWHAAFWCRYAPRHPTAIGRRCNIANRRPRPIGSRRCGPVDDHDLSTSR
jgi:hypothetical protein